MASDRVGARSYGSLYELQNIVAEMEAERGFSDDSVVEKALLLAEEVGELAKVIRRFSGVPTEESFAYGMAEPEVADVLIVLCTIANRLHVDLAEAVRAKLAADQGRVWVRSNPADS